MKKHAIFVDAGYLLSEGTRLLAGRVLRRDEIAVDTTLLDKLLSYSLNILAHVKYTDTWVLTQNEREKFIFESMNSMRNEISGSELLRIYWYDGISRNGILTPQQEKIAETNHFKFRYGYINAAKQQKGVDALLTTDLLELARNKSITDAVIIAGDEDLMLGMQLAQSQGIRCHLIGIDPVKNNQSIYIRREADSAHIWDKDIVSQILKLNLPTP
jgi:uncharacterized LabA/DUF88 family protein